MPTRAGILVVCSLLPGCMRAGFYSPQSNEDSRVQVDAPHIDAPRADSLFHDGSDTVTLDLSHPDLPTQPFSPPTPVSTLNTAGNEDSPTLTGDMLEIYFERDGNIWSAKRANVADNWSPPAKVLELSSTVSDRGPKVLPHGLTLYLISERQDPASQGAGDIFVAQRKSRGDAWGTPSIVPELSSSGVDYPGTPTTDGQLMVLASDRAGAVGPVALYWSSRSSATSTWTPPVLVPGINSQVWDTNPWLSSGGRILSFASTRSGSLGQHDLWIAFRPDRAAPFGPPIHLKEVSSSGFDMEPWLSSDLRVIYFTRGYPKNDIYTATR